MYEILDSAVVGWGGGWGGGVLPLGFAGVWSERR